MTVEVDDTVERYTISGTGPYAFSFRIFSEDDLTVRVIDGDGLPTTLTIDTHYTVPDASVNDEDGGSISLISATATLYDGLTLDIRSETPIEQPTDMDNQGAFRLQAIEAALDRQTRQLQDVRRLVKSCLRLQDIGTFDAALSPLVNWLDKYVYINANGEPEPAAGVSNVTLTQSVIAGLLIPQTAAESAAGVTPTNYAYEPGDLFRYGGTGGDSVLDTAAFQAALNTGHIVRIRKTTLPWEFDRITIPSDTVIWCDPGVEVLMPDGGLVTNLPWIRMVDVERVTLHGNGSTWAFETKPSADENRHVFDMRGSSKVTMRDVKAEKAGGDGFYVGAGIVNDYCSDIVLENVSADNCRRQGISIVSAKNCWVNGALIENITGTSPQSGIDIEPNVSTDELKGIRISNVVTRDCSGAGIKAVINDLPADYELDIVIENHLDEGSLNGFQASFGTTMTGRFLYNDGVSILAGGNGIDIRSWGADSTWIEINRPVVINPNEDNDVTNAYNGNGIAVYNASDSSILDIGRVVIREPRILDNRGSPQMKDAIYSRSLVASGEVHDVRVIDPQGFSGQTGDMISLIGVEDHYIRDSLELTRLDRTTDFTLSISQHHAHITNSGASAQVVITLDDDIQPGETLYRFTVLASQNLRIDPEANSTILGFGRAAGEIIQSNEPGKFIVLKRASLTAWEVVAGGEGWNGTAFTAFTANDATPSVRNGKQFVTANASGTTITALDDGSAGKEVVVKIGDANTTVDFTGTTLKGNGGSDWSPTSGDFMRCVFDGTNWICSIHDTTA